MWRSWEFEESRGGTVVEWSTSSVDLEACVRAGGENLESEGFEVLWPIR